MSLSKSIASVILCFSLLFSSLGFSISKHYCLGMLKDVSYFGLPEKCGSKAHSCESFKSQYQYKHSCCLDETQVFPAIPVVKTDEKDFSLFPAFSIQIYLAENPSDYHSSDFHLKNKRKFAPPEKPIPPNNIRIENQRFLI